MADGKRGRRPDSDELKAAKDKLKKAKTEDEKVLAKADVERIQAKEKAAKQGAPANRTTEASVWRPEDLDDEQKGVVFLQGVASVSKAAELKKQADQALKDAVERAEAHYGEQFSDHMKLHLRLQTDQGKKVFRETIDGAAFIARLNDVPIQHDLFSEDRMPLEDATFNEGRRVGMAAGDPHPPPHLGGPLASRWTDGYHDGQETARKRLLTMQAPPPARDLDEGTEVFDYFAEGVEARRRGNVDPPEDYSLVQIAEWERGWNHENAARDGAEAAAAA